MDATESCWKLSSTVKADLLSGRLKTNFQPPILYLLSSNHLEAGNTNNPNPVNRNGHLD